MTQKQRLTQQQKSILQQLRAGRRLIHRPYTPGIHLPACTYWEEDRDKFWGRDNHNIVMRALIKKGYVDLKKELHYGNFEIVLTRTGRGAKI